MVISLAGVVMIAQPSFIFGGQGLNKLGLLFGLMQVSGSNCTSSILGFTVEDSGLRVMAAVTVICEWCITRP